MRVIEKITAQVLTMQNKLPRRPLRLTWVLPRQRHLTTRRRLLVMGREQGPEVWTVVWQSGASTKRLQNAPDKLAVAPGPEQVPLQHRPVVTSKVLDVRLVQRHDQMAALLLALDVAEPEDETPKPFKQPFEVQVMLHDALKAEEKTAEMETPEKVRLRLVCELPRCLVEAVRKLQGCYERLRAVAYLAQPCR